MICPISIGGYPRASDVLQRDFARLRNEIRPEIIDITKGADSIDIHFRNFSSGSVSIRAHYTDGLIEPEIFIDKSGGSTFNSSDYIDIFSECRDILMTSVKAELRNNLLQFLKISKITNSILNLLFKRVDNSSLRVSDNAKIVIEHLLNNSLILYEFSVGNFGSLTILNGPLQFHQAFLLTEPIDLEALTDDKRKYMSDNLIMFDDLIQILTRFYDTNKLNDDFTHAQFSDKGKVFTVTLSEDGTSIQIAADGRVETLQLRNLRIDDLLEKINYICTPIP